MPSIRCILSFGTLVIAMAIPPASIAAQPTTRPVSQIGEGGNDHGFDMAPETRLDAADAAVAKIPTTPPAGPFQPTWDSLQQNYKVPQWFIGAKFGLFLHVEMNKPTWTDSGNPILPPSTGTTT